MKTLLFKIVFLGTLFLLNDELYAQRSKAIHFEKSMNITEYTADSHLGKFLEDMTKIETCKQWVVHANNINDKILILNFVCSPIKCTTKFTGFIRVGNNLFLLADNSPLFMFSKGKEFST